MDLEYIKNVNFLQIIKSGGKENISTFFQNDTILQLYLGYLNDKNADFRALQ